MIDSFPLKYPNCKNLGPIGFSIRESESGNITSLLPFQQLTGTQECEMFIIANKKLTSLEGLNNIDSLKNGLLIQHNAINGIRALSKLKYCKWSITIEEDSLVNLAGLENLNYAFQLALFSNNPARISLKHLSGLNKASNLIFAGNYIFENLNIKYVKNLTIRSNEFIENLNGIFVDSLVDNFYLTLNHDFSFEGQDKPFKINTFFIYGDKTNVLTFKGIEDYSRIKNLHIFDFYTFRNETSLENLIIDQTLHLENIIKYPNHFLSAFHHLDSIDVLGLVNLDSLYNLNGLEKIKELSGLRLSGNVNLNNIDALTFAKASEPYKFVYISNKQYYLMINDNPSLNYCHIPVVCKMIADIVPGKLFIEGNNQLCKSKSTIQEQCIGVGTTENNEGIPIKIFPNPVSRGQLIKVINREGIEDIRLLDVNGQEVVSTKNQFLQIPHHLAQGIYFLVFHVKDRFIVEKLFVN